MTSFFQQISEDSPTFRQALLKSEKKRILGIVLFVLFFVLLAAVRIFALGSAMSRWGLLTAAILIAFELGLFWAVNRALQSGKEVPQFAWYWTLTLESLFPASGVAFLSSTQLHVDYRPLATPWVLAYFPLILLSVLRLSPRLCCFSGFTSAFGYLTAAFFLGWRFNPKDGFTVTESAVPYFALLLATMGILAAMVASQIRSYVEAALREADTRHQLKQVEHELQIARSIQQSLLPKLRPQIPGFAVAGWSQSADDTGGDFYDWKRLSDGRWAVFLADVTGHGLGPAMLASVCRAYSRASFNERDNLATIFRNINQSSSEDLTPERFATFVAAVFREGSDQVELLSAGHGPLFITLPETSLCDTCMRKFCLSEYCRKWKALFAPSSRWNAEIWCSSSLTAFSNGRILGRSHSEPIVLPKSFEGSVIAIQKSSSPSFKRRSLASPEGRRSRMI